MLSVTAFREEHDNGFDGRPQRIQRLRAEFREYADLTVPRRLPAVMEWYTNHKSVITRRLTDQPDDEPGGGS